MNQPLIAGRYEIRDLLGRGASGTVLEAMDRRLGRLVVLKLIRRPDPDDRDAEGALIRARQEAQSPGGSPTPASSPCMTWGRGRITPGSCWNWSSAKR